MARAELRAGATVAALVLGLGAGGCAVLTVDVDVYKGALANHPEVQTEQLAAMAMGVKPLLAELRYTLEKEECYGRISRAYALRLEPAPPVTDKDAGKNDDCQPYLAVARKAGFVPDGDKLLLSRDARRVNAILSLYEDARDVTAAEVLKPLEEALRLLVDRTEKGSKVIRPYFPASPELRVVQDRLDYLAQRARGVTSPTRAGKATVPPPSREQLAAVRDAWQSATDAWLEALRLLASADNRTALNRIRPDAVSIVAWIAADLTSPEGLNRLFKHDSADKKEDSAAEPCPGAGRPPALHGGQLDRLAGYLPILASGGCLGRQHHAAIRALVAQMLTDDVGAGPGAPGSAVQLARELGVARAYAATQSARDWDIVVFPSGAALEEFKEVLEFSREDLDALRSLFAGALSTGLGRGRPDDGIESLIEDFLRSTSAPDDAVNPRTKLPFEKRSVIRRKLLNGLINFGEKVVVLADMDTLVRGVSRDEAQPFVTVETNEVSKYIRLLQAVGNSILSQVDAQKQSDAHRLRLSGVAAAIEQEGLRSAETSLPPMSRRIIEELQLKPATFPGRAGILSSLQKGQADVDNALAELGGTLLSERASLATRRSDARDLGTAHEALIDPVLEETLAGLGTPPPTIEEVRLAIRVKVQSLEDAARLAPGATTETAKRWATVGGVLDREEFLGQETTTRAGARDRHAALVRLVSRAKDRADAEVEKATSTVADLERWYAAARRSGGGRRPVGLPAAVKNATDVVDAVLAALRYEHVSVVASEGPDAPLARNLAAAIDLNAAYRSGMVHIRPAATYLRNSYPATVLQNDPRAGAWTNMLGEQGRRQLPLFDTYLAQGEAARVQRTIDKQFWQSVNQIRVAGAGDTNYVIAKDDVGNWYVKSYSADPKEIIQSARSLAMFAAGPAMGANFLARGSGQASGVQTLRSAATTAAGGQAASPTLPGSLSPVTEAAPGKSATPPTTEAARSTLGKQLDRFTERFEQQTLDTRQVLKRDAEGLPAHLRAAAAADGVAEDDLKKLDTAVLKPVAGKTFDDLTATQVDGNKKPLARLGAEIVAALRAVKAYRMDAVARLMKITGTAAGQLTEETATTIATAFDRVFKDVLTRTLRDRQGVSTQYESTLLIVGESAGL